MCCFFISMCCSYLSTLWRISECYQCFVLSNCVLTGYAAEPLNVIGHIRQTLHEWGLLSPPSDITALSHLFSPHVDDLNSARRRLQVRGLFTTALLLFTAQQLLSGEAELGQTTALVTIWPSRTSEQKVWSFISQQIQIRILIQPLNLLYPFNLRLGVCIRMWARDWARRWERGWSADSAPNGLKIQLYISLCLLNVTNELIP